MDVNDCETNINRLNREIQQAQSQMNGLTHIVSQENNLPQMLQQFTSLDAEFKIKEKE